MKQYWYRMVTLLSIFYILFLNTTPVFAATRTLYPVQVRTLYELTGAGTDGIMQLGNSEGTGTRQWISAYFDWSPISTSANLLSARLDVQSTGGSGDCSAVFSVHASISPWNITNRWDGQPNGLAMATGQTITCSGQITVPLINELELQHVRVNGLVLESTDAGQNAHLVDIDPATFGLVIGYTVVADANDDGKVEELDYAVWLSHFGQSITGVNNGDFNGEGKVDGVDYVVWLKNYTP